MFNSNPRYNDYYLVANEDDIGNDMETFDGVVAGAGKQPNCVRKNMSCILLIIVVGLGLSLVVVFVIVPVVFMYSLSLQQMLIFTHFNLPSNKSYYEDFHLPGFRNMYVTVKDIDGTSNLTLGLWHILPTNLAYESLHTNNFDYDKSLQTSNYSVLFYFHGTGESRADSLQKYLRLRINSHIICFDYRSYADSYEGVMSEKAVVNDCVQLYKWLRNQTESKIYIWGHSLGSALAAHTVSTLISDGISPQGLILESAFTSLASELYVHPTVKFFSWLPWFKVTIVDPLTHNGFIFDTKDYIKNATCPIMILHAQDDSIVPYSMAEKLFSIAKNRDGLKNETVIHLFNKRFKHGHIYIYEDSYLIFYLLDFMHISKENYNALEAKTISI